VIRPDKRDKRCDKRNVGGENRSYVKYGKNLRYTLEFRIDVVIEVIYPCIGKETGTQTTQSVRYSFLPYLRANPTVSPKSAIQPPFCPIRFPL
jgi:hypothetical protein